MAAGFDWTSHVRRWVFAGAGVVCAGLGALGAILPGLPTTIFLLIASYCFTRSCPWLEERLLRNRLFAPYMAIIDGRQPMTRGAKAVALTMMWVAVTTSFAVLRSRDLLPAWAAALLLVAALIGTVAIAADAMTRLRGASAQPVNAPAE